MNNQDYYVFEENADNHGDEIIIEDIEFKLENYLENSSFSEVAHRRTSA